MSTNYVNFVPTDRMLTFDDVKSKPAIERLKQMVEAWDIWYTQSELPEPHALLAIGSVWCPHCKAEVEMETFGTMIERQYQEAHFVNLDVIMPCCGKLSALDQLDYRGQIGFGRYCIEIEQPSTVDWEPVVKFLEEWFGCSFLQLEYRI